MMGWLLRSMISTTSFGAPLAIVGGDAGLYPVAVQYRAAFHWWQVKVGRAIVWHDKTMAITVALNGSRDFCRKIFELFCV